MGKVIESFPRRRQACRAKPRKDRLLMPRSTKIHLDNTEALRYINIGRGYHNENCHWVSGPTTYNK